MTPQQCSDLDLPINEARRQLIDLIKSCQTLVLVGETGSGKSTQLPQFVLQAGLAQVITISRAVQLNCQALEAAGHSVGLWERCRADVLQLHSLVVWPP